MILVKIQEMYHDAPLPQTIVDIILNKGRITSVVKIMSTILSEKYTFVKHHKLDKFTFIMFHCR